MATEITSKSELMAMASKLESKFSEIIDSMSSISSTLKSASNYDGIDVSSAASLLSTNLSNLSTDFSNIAKNVTNYATLIAEFDTDDFAVDSSSDADVNDSTITLSTSDTGDNNSTQSSNTSTTVSSGIYAGVVSSTTSSSSNNAGKHYSNSSSTTTSTPTTSTSTNTSTGGGKISAIGPVKITEGDPNNPDIDITKYSNYKEKGFEVTTGNLCYELSEKDIELLCAIVSAESDKSYDDALAVITTILNRCETENWIRSHGTDPIAQATAPNQFVVYQHGSYKAYMNGKAPETVVQAVKDALAGVRNHKYLSFRSNGTTSYSDNMITKTGNRYK